MTQTNLMLLFAGAVLVGLVAVVIDRLNFPQKRFNPKTVRPMEKHARDRTGAHITEFEPQATHAAVVASIQEDQERQDT